MSHSPLTGLHFDNAFTRTLPADPVSDNYRRQVAGAAYSRVHPTPVAAPSLVAHAAEVATLLDLTPADCASPAFLRVFAGNELWSGMDPYAMCYGGHQFGHWAGQLGDGRAITLGEWQKPDGRCVEFQLKGAGITPYSRGADGRAVLRSSLREYLMSEAMHHLGVPTTRALSLVSTGDGVMRDMFYNGFPELEPGAIVLRVSPSFLRFGNFEMLAARKETEQLKRLADWTIERYFPDARGDNQYIAWFEMVMERTAKLMVEWERVGFVHGVMNTDNMSVLGLTIDYGPYSFLDDYDSNFTPNTTDLPGKRYAFGKQAQIAQWNLGCFAGAIAPLVDDSKELLALIEKYAKVYWQEYYRMMSGKLGFDEIKDEDTDFVLEWNKMLDTLHPDMTIFYRLLMTMESPSYEHFKDSFYEDLKEEEEQFLLKILTQYHTRLHQNNISKKASLAHMNRSNPHFVLRNYLLQQAIEALQNSDDSLFKKLQAAILHPYDGSQNEFFQKRPDWAKQKAGCSMLSCSS